MGFEFLFLRLEEDCFPHLHERLHLLHAAAIYTAAADAAARLRASSTTCNPKHNVMRVERRGWFKRHEELAAVCVRPAVRQRDHPPSIKT
jgi:hypothetical protein